MKKSYNTFRIIWVNYNLSHDWMEQEDFWKEWTGCFKQRMKEGILDDSPSHWPVFFRRAQLLMKLVRTGMEIGMQLEVSHRSDRYIGRSWYSCWSLNKTALFLNATIGLEWNWMRNTTEMDISEGDWGEQGKNKLIN